MLRIKSVTGKQCLLVPIRRTALGTVATQLKIAEKVKATGLAGGLNLCSSRNTCPFDQF